MDLTSYVTPSLLGQAYRAMRRTAEASREAETAEKLQSAATPRLETPH